MIKLDPSSPIHIASVVKGGQTWYCGSIDDWLYRSIPKKFWDQPGSRDIVIKGLEDSLVDSNDVYEYHLTDHDTCNQSRYPGTPKKYQ